MPPPKGLSGSFFSKVLDKTRPTMRPIVSAASGIIGRCSSREILMIELLAAEGSNEAPDNGALSWSGDKFEL
ncbi:hypothetical protein B0H10DRAFT_2103174 [Mycena sp. CBHHK59/15]|nr:hypothetical protein B0H10DRAFT_2103174 [Mycena sp. CBHHK59/15]